MKGTLWCRQVRGVGGGTVSARLSVAGVGVSLCRSVTVCVCVSVSAASARRQHVLRCRLASRRSRVAPMHTRAWDSSVRLPARGGGSHTLSTRRTLFLRWTLCAHGAKAGVGLVDSCGSWFGWCGVCLLPWTNRCLLACRRWWLLVGVGWLVGGHALHGGRRLHGCRLLSSASTFFAVFPSGRGEACVLIGRELGLREAIDNIVVITS
jgi:hypothetical protein